MSDQSEVFGRDLELIQGRFAQAGLLPLFSKVLSWIARGETLMLVGPTGKHEIVDRGKAEQERDAQIVQIMDGMADLPDRWDALRIHLGGGTHEADDDLAGAEAEAEAEAEDSTPPA